MMLRHARVLACLSVLVLMAACSSETTPTGGGSSGGIAVSPPDGGEVVAAPPTAPDDGPYWPRFHGPNGDNISGDTGLLKQWPDGGPPLDWTCEEIGGGYSSVSIGGGLIYTAGNIDKKTMISAIDMDGNIKWQVENGAAWTASHPGTRGTPTIDGDRLYHQSPVGSVICLNAKTGDKIWSINSLETFHAENITWALAESLLIDGDRVICCPGGPEASMVALNKMTGEVVWKAESTGDKTAYATTSLVEFGGLRIIFAMTAKALVGVDAENGRLLFKHPFETEYDANSMMPLFSNGHVFISGGYGTTGSELLKVVVQGDKASVEKVWGSRDLDNHHGGVLLIDGFLYGAAHQFSKGQWICLDWKSGETKWAAYGVGGRNERKRKGSSTYADGLMYMLSEDQHVGLTKISPAGLEIISEFSLPEGSRDPSWAHPVVCGGRLYIRHDNRLFAYNVKANGE